MWQFLQNISGSKDAALAFSLILNCCLAWALLKIYRAKERLQQQIVDLLREIVPLATRIKDRLHEQD